VQVQGIPEALFAPVCVGVGVGVGVGAPAGGSAVPCVLMHPFSRSPFVERAAAAHVASVTHTTCTARTADTPPSMALRTTPITLFSTWTTCFADLGNQVEHFFSLLR
jgi:hypothetical protein